MTDIRWLLPPSAQSVPEARRRTTSVLAEWGLESLCDTAVLLVSEVVTNAVLHARTDIVVELTRTLAGKQAGVQVSVSDGSPLPPALRRHSDMSTTGRGIRLLDLLSDSWQAEPTDTGKTVTFLVSAGRDPWAAAESMLAEADR